MPTLKYLDRSFSCATAIKGNDYIHLLDDKGILIAAFDDISDFSGFTLEDGSYVSPTADHNCKIAVIRDDGTIGAGGHTCADIGTALAQDEETRKHWWSVLHSQASTGYEEERTAITDQVKITGTYDETGTISYSKGITIDQTNGTVAMVDAKTLEIDLSESADGFIGDLTALLPVYITGLHGTPDSIYYLPSTSTFGATGSCTVHAVVYNGDYSDDTDFGTEVYLNAGKTVPDAQKACAVSSRIYNIAQGKTTYLQSAERNAYPDYAVTDGRVYRYLGVPFTNARSAAIANVQEYTGTGSTENPVSLTFERMPQLVVITKVVASGDTSAMAMAFPLQGYAISLTTLKPFAIEVEGLTIRIADTMNDEGQKYLAMAIG